MDDPYTRLYNRHPLVPTRHDIRLLYITPGDRDEPMHCTLQVKSLDESPEFEALSYVWGDEFDTVPIAAEDVTLDVTLNLYSALRALRPRPGNSRRPFWVDAYSVRAGFPHIPGDAALEASWREESVDSERDDDSGSDDDNFVSTFAPLVTSGAKTLGFLEEVQAVDGLTAFKEFFILTTVLQAFLTAEDGGQNVCKNVYWRRIWTFQEYELPAAVPLCRYGEISIRWEKLEISIAWKIQVYVIQSIERLCPKLPSVVEALPTPEMKDLANGILKNMGFEDAITKCLIRESEWIPAWVLLKRRTKRRQIISTLFWTTHDCEYSDPRDKVYALYGLLPTLATAHPPDYNRDPSIVIVEALAFDVNRHSKMFYLGLSDMPLQLRRLASDRPQQFPSWMPAVSARSETPLLDGTLTLTLRWLPVRKGEVSGLFQSRAEDQEGRTIKPSIIADQHILKSPVIRLRGTTKKIVTFGETLEEIQSQLVSLVDSLLKMQLFTSLPNLPARLIRCMSSYHMTEATNDFLVSQIDSIISNRQNSETALAVDLGLFLDEEPRVRYLLELRLQEEVREELQHKTVFIIDERMLGFGMDIRDGDTICIIPTVRLPFAICKEREDPEHGTIWNMVGAVYIDGLMENEGLDRVVVEELLNTALEMLTFQ
ncbi:hypothetical protein QBC37DRAFT_485835 [Rhypophila decipiens]|uniref:Heterokaryon incompatibility domain-containing protein n=1 Tax=Rhypophila decipiens TaxID=261697 RepID=A0AAN7B4L1_9PEZI|nr:hypothetical protein QBC37DRAFT_485835 [Rhypophila decipiens]